MSTTAAAALVGGAAAPLIQGAALTLTMCGESRGVVAAGARRSMMPFGIGPAEDRLRWWYGLVALVSLTQLARIHHRVPEYG